MEWPVTITMTLPQMKFVIMDTLGSQIPYIEWMHPLLPIRLEETDQPTAHSIGVGVTVL